MKYLIAIFIFFIIISNSYGQKYKKKIEKDPRNIGIICDINHIRHITGKITFVLPPEIKDSSFYADYILKDSLIVNRKGLIDSLYKTNIFKMHDAYIEIITINKNQVLIKTYIDKE